MATSWQQNYSKYQQYFVNMVALYKTRPDLKAFLELFLSLGTIGILGIFAVRPTALTITQLLTDINNKQETVNLMDTKIKNLAAAQALMSSQKGNIDLLASAVPDFPEPNTYIRQVEGVAQKDGVTLTSSAIDSTTLKGKAEAVPTQVDANQKVSLPDGAKGLSLNFLVAGNYQQIISFLTDLENLRRPIILDGITLGTTQEKINLNLSIKGAAPYQQQ